MMMTIKHTPQGWRLSRSCLTFPTYTGAIAYFAASDPEGAAAMLAAMKCEACGKPRSLEPETVGSTFMLTCKSCRSYPSTAAGAADHLGKVAKKAHVVHELSRPEWIESTRKEVKRFGLKTTGVQSLDDELRLPHAPKYEPYSMRIVIAQADAPTDCSVCGEPLNGEFVDGVMAYAGWGYQHPECHKTHGIGLGHGRGHLYLKEADGSYRKAKPAVVAEPAPEPEGGSDGI